MGVGALGGAVTLPFLLSNASFFGFFFCKRKKTCGMVDKMRAWSPHPPTHLGLIVVGFFFHLQFRQGSGDVRIPWYSVQDLGFVH